MTLIRMVLVGLIALALGGCLTSQAGPGFGGPSTSQPQPTMSHDDLFAELAAQNQGPMAYQKFLLKKSPWECFESCPGTVSLHFSESSVLSSDLLARVNWQGRSYQSRTYLWPDYKATLQGVAAFPCTMVTNNYLQCRVYNSGTGITDTLGFRRKS